MPVQPALLGGLYIGVLSALPLIGLGNCCCCLWVVTGGMLAVYLDEPTPEPRAPVRGAVLGLMAGVIGAFVWLIVGGMVQTMLAPLQERLLAELLRGPVDLPPQVRDLLEMSRDAEPGVMAQAVNLILYLVIGTIFATLGGLLGAVFFWREHLPPAVGGPPLPPPLPPHPPE